MANVIGCTSDQIWLIRVATVREKVWKMKFFPGQGKVREFGFESGKIAKSAKVREKSGNFKIFSKMMVFGNVSMSFLLKLHGFHFLRISN